MIFTIARKELAHQLNSQFAYILAMIFVVSLPLPVFWFTSNANVFLTGQADLSGFFNLIPFYLMIFIPALAMRSWSEERNSGTFELLTTLPLAEHQLVVGKFLGNFIMLGCCLSATMIVPLLLSHMADLDWGPVWGGYIASLLLAACCLAIAMFMGSFTNHGATAFTLGFVVLALLMITAPYEANLMARFSNVARGILDTRDMLYYFCLTCAALVLNTFVITWKR